MPRQAWPAVAVVALLAGCLGGADDGAPAVPPAPTETAASPATPEPAPPAPQPAVPAAPFTMDATGCVEMLYMAPVPVAQAREFVPAGYALLGEGSGMATAFVALKRCADLVLDGESIGNGSTGDVGVFIDRGEPGVFHYYQAWWTTDNPRLWSRLAALGWRGGVSFGEGMLVLGDLPVGSVSASVSHANASYTISGNVQAAPLQGDNHAVGWFDTPGGTMVVDKLLMGTRTGAGRATFSGTGEAAMLMGSDPTGSALWMEYGMAGSVAYAG